LNTGDLYATPENQERLVLGQTEDGNIAFATRGGNTQHDYDRCQIQRPEVFTAEATLVNTVVTDELARVQSKFAPWLAAKNIR